MNMKTWEGVSSDLTFLMSNFICVFRMSLEALRRSRLGKSEVLALAYVAVLQTPYNFFYDALALVSFTQKLELSSVLHKCGEINPGLGNDGIGIHNHIIS
jgi:hypothetical protein